MLVRIPPQWALKLLLRRPGQPDDTVRCQVQAGDRIGDLRRSVSADHGLALDRWRMVSKAPTGYV